MDLKLRHLRTFLAVAEYRHFGRAAQALALPQPTVSRHIRDLESELGVALLIRTSRTTRLTDAGAAVIDHAQALLDRAERLRSAAEIAARQAGGEVTVAFIASTVNAYLTPLLQALAATRPDVEVRATQLRMADVVAKLRDGAADLAIARDPRSSTELVAQTLLSEPVLAVIPARHPLAERAQLAVEDLRGEPLVVLDPSVWPPGHAAFVERLRAHGVEPWIVRSGASHQAAVALVAAGAGIYQLPASAAIPRDDVRYVELAGVRSRIVLLRRPTLPTPALAAVIAAALGLADQTLP
jgi:DNA-binding transcriptional LysR family regulator